VSNTISFSLAMGFSRRFRSATPGSGGGARAFYKLSPRGIRRAGPDNRLWDKCMCA
jgi:hypothetical protein